MCTHVFLTTPHPPVKFRLYIDDHVHGVLPACLPCPACLALPALPCLPCPALPACPLARLLNCAVLLPLLLPVSRP